MEKLYGELIMCIIIFQRLIILLLESILVSNYI